MKITKNILREMIEAEMKEAVGKGPDDLPSQADSTAAQSDKKVAAAFEARLPSDDVKLLDGYLMGGTKIIKRNSRGEKVKALQRAIIESLKENSLSHHFKMGEVDGIFGDDTLAAVKALQDIYKITKDGVVGRQTWTAIKTNGKAIKKSSNVRSSSADLGTSAQETDPVRPEDLGTAFQWGDELGVWWAEGKHTYNDAEYNLWIRKDELDYHANGEYSKLSVDDFTSGGTNESTSRYEGIISLTEDLELTLAGDKYETDTDAKDMNAKSESEETEEEVTEQNERVATVVTEFITTTEFYDLINITELGSLDEKDFANNLVVLNLSSDNLIYLNVLDVLGDIFEEKFDLLLSYVFDSQEGLDGYQVLWSAKTKNEFKESYGYFPNIKNNQLTLQALITHINSSGLIEKSEYVERAEDVWDKFISEDDQEFSLTFEMSIFNPTDNVDDIFIYTGHEKFITLRIALDKLDEITDSSSPTNESFSFDRLSKLAGLLKS